MRFVYPGKPHLILVVIGYKLEINPRIQQAFQGAHDYTQMLHTGIFTPRFPLVHVAIFHLSC